MGNNLILKKKDIHPCILYAFSFSDPTYLQPIAKFDEIIANTVKQIESEVNMKEEFMVSD